MWGATYDGEGNIIKGTHGRESGGRRDGGTPSSDSLIEAREKEVGLTSISCSVAVINNTACCVRCKLLTVRLD